MKMTSSRPYLLRALYQWIVDNNLTPYILVDATHSGVDVPLQFVKDGKIVLNLSPASVVGLSMEGDVVAFSARFSGVAREIFVPIVAVAGIYARENGQGMMFEAESGNPDPDPASNSAPTAKPAGKPKPALKIVK